MPTQRPVLARGATQAARSRRWLALLATLLVAATLLTACGARTARPRLAVRGNLLVVGGSRWIARGVVDYLVPFYTDGPGVPDPALASYVHTDFTERNRAFAAMRADGINVVRVPVGTPGVGSAYHLNLASYVRHLVLVAAAAHAAGLRVLICWWDSLAQGSQLVTSYRADFPMMAAVARALRRDPWVFFEPDNEPNGVTVAQWLRVMEATDREWRRVIGYRGPLVMDTPGYSWSFPVQAAAALQHLDASLLGSAPQLVFANQRYPDGVGCFCSTQQAQWQALVGRWVGHYPILGTEYGDFNAGFPVNGAWLVELARYLLHVAVPRGDNGMITFVWSWVDPNSLTTTDHRTLNHLGTGILHSFWMGR